MGGYIWPMHEHGEKYQAYQTDVLANTPAARTLAVRYRT